MGETPTIPGITLHATQHPRGFTRTDLLALAAVFAVGLGCVLPVLGQVRNDERLTACANNLKAIGVASAQYAADFDGKLFYTEEDRGRIWREPDTTPKDYQNGAWYDPARIGRYIEGTEMLWLHGEVDEAKLNGRLAPNLGLGGGVLACPSDEPDGARSYHMNYWGSGSEMAGKPAVSQTTRGGLGGGVYFDSSVRAADRIFLFADVFSSERSVEGWATVHRLQLADLTPGERFGGSGLGAWPNPHSKHGLGVTLPSPFDYPRHATNKNDKFRTGKVNFAFVDGHVSTASLGELVDAEGDATDRVFWSPSPVTLSTANSAN